MITGGNMMSGSAAGVARLRLSDHRADSLGCRPYIPTKIGTGRPPLAVIAALLLFAVVVIAFPWLPGVVVLCLLAVDCARSPTGRAAVLAALIRYRCARIGKTPTDR